MVNHTSVNDETYQKPSLSYLDNTKPSGVRKQQQFGLMCTVLFLTTLIKVIGTVWGFVPISWLDFEKKDCFSAQCLR